MRAAGAGDRADVESAISEEYLRSIVERPERIGSHPLGFRVAGTPEERAAVDLISSEFRSLGLEPVNSGPASR
jgi:hypothetical protein